MTYFVTLSCGNGLDWLTVLCVCVCVCVCSQSKRHLYGIQHSKCQLRSAVHMYYIPLLNAQRLQLCKYCHGLIAPGSALLYIWSGV